VRACVRARVFYWFSLILAHLETLSLSSVCSFAELSELFLVSGLLTVDTLLVSGCMTGVQ
jgi:hypothetical protein